MKFEGISRSRSRTRRRWLDWDSVYGERTWRNLWRGAGAACIGVRIGGAGAVLRALVDTGSPVSLLRYSAYVMYVSDKKLIKVENHLVLRGVNKSITVRERIVNQIYSFRK
jgi:hypothetical protein